MAGQKRLPPVIEFVEAAAANDPVGLCRSHGELGVP